MRMEELLANVLHLMGSIKASRAMISTKFPWVKASTVGLSASITR